MENEYNQQSWHIRFVQRKWRNSSCENLYAFHTRQSTQRYNYEKSLFDFTSCHVAGNYCRRIWWRLFPWFLNARFLSQETFDDLCPAQSKKFSLCVILVIKNSLHPQDIDPKIVFRRFVEEYSQQYSSVSFMYVYKDYQPEFTLPIEGIEIFSLISGTLTKPDQVSRNHFTLYPKFVLWDHRHLWTNEKQPISM